ncbi:hypothetical protein M2418_002819 [Rhizobium sp. BIGb0125]|nr:hypothetical protein [Rhizobium sp. BIGb0125]
MVFAITESGNMCGNRVQLTCKYNAFLLPLTSGRGGNDSRFLMNEPSECVSLIMKWLTVDGSALNRRVSAGSCAFKIKSLKSDIGNYLNYI